uniref:Uncharacterized protein n=1 Tax=Homalodisca liturata TaxID=320908 RepID=A0A1B6I862_9HEMI
MSRKISAQDYPDHLNPFDENYNGLEVPGASAGTGREKYNTWSSSRPNQVSTLARQKQKPTFLEKPWAALNISPKGKIVRRLSILKTAVEKFASKKKRLSQSSSESVLPPRSHSFHDEFNFKIISPKLKEKIRQQAFNTPITRVDSNAAEEPRSPESNGRLTLPLRTDAVISPPAQDLSPTSPDHSFPGPRPKTRKKRPPPPPPAESSKSPSLEFPSGQDVVEDNHSINSSITQDLEKDASSEEETSLSVDSHRVQA